MTTSTVDRYHPCRPTQSALCRPAVSRIALSPGWIFGLAAALALAAVALNRRWRRSEQSRVIALAALALVAVGLAIGTAWAGVWPFARLAGNISAG